MLRIQKPPYPGFGEIFPALLRMEQALSIQLTLIGAGARNVWLELGGEILPARMTRDVDLAILVASLDLYENAQAYLIDHEHFSKLTHLPHAISSPGGIQVDLLPYGPIALQHEVHLHGMDSPLQLQGLDEACEQAVKVQFQEQGSFWVITPAALLMLKLVAFDDRPTHRGNDLDDVSRLLTSGYTLFFQDIQEQHWDILTMYEVNDTYALHVGSHYLGRKLEEVVNSSDSLKARLTEIIARHQKDAAAGPLTRALMRPYGLSEAEAIGCIASLSRGFFSNP
ncbi:MAG: hypothetical protein EAZ89_10040 [Bacteroidetes bacterium]|nr:MAG: hypothetical protein EAZ89_10040 [Bacteroidota bacterium]